MSTHTPTPGPWMPDVKAVYSLAADGMRNGAVCVAMGKHRDEAEKRANARLISEAPDMLAALKKHIAEYDPELCSPDSGCIECTVGTVPNRLNTGLCFHHLAKRAIARAEGR